MNNFKSTNLHKLIILSLVSFTLYGCKSEIPSSSDNSDQPANQTVYNLMDSHSSDTAVIASPYEVDVNLESETSNLQVGVEPTAEAQASNIQLHFLDPQNTNRFNTTYSDACNSLDTSSSCQITLVPNNNAQLIDNQTVGYYITGNINGSLTRLKPEYFIVKSLTTEPNAFIGSGGQSQLTIYNNTGVDVDLSGYQFKSDDTQLSAQLSEALQTGDSYVLANNKKFIVNVSATDDHTNSRSAVLMVNSAGINAVDSTINIIRPSVNLSPNQLTLWPNQIRTITIENNTPALAKVSDISLSNIDGVSLDTSNCDDGIIGFSSCKVTLTSKKKIATKEVDLIVTGENFDTQQASVYTELPNPSIKPVNVDMTPNQLTLLPNHNNTITISNHSATQSAYVKEIDLPGLTDAEVTSNTCGNTISALDSCQISFSVDHNVAKQRAYLSISGKNFLPQESQITTISTPRAKKATQVEITPSQLTLIPNHTQKLTVKNLTSNKAYLKEIDLPSLSDVLITNNCSDVDYLTSKGSCEIIFQSGKQIGSSSNTVSVYGKNFLSKEAHITAKSPHLPGKPTSIDLIPNQITLLPNQSKSIVINNQSRVATKGLAINIPTLDGVTVTNNTCGDELLGETSCMIEFKANSDVVSKQSDSLLVTGNNFLSKQAQIDTNNPKIQLKKLTRVEITPSQLVLLPSQTREMTISNMTATTADIKELDILDLSGVTITNNCGSEIAGLSSCTIEYKAAKKLPLSEHGNVLIYGKNFLSEKAQVIAKAVNPPVIPTSVELNTNQVMLLPGESKKIVVTNRTRVKTQGLTVTISELDGVSINNGCKGEVLAKSESCIIQLEANKKFPTQQATLQVNGDNFLAHSVEVNTKMLNPSFKPTSIEVSPSQLVLLPNQTKTITVMNRTQIKADIKEIQLPDLTGVKVTQNTCANGHINGKGSCIIQLHAGRSVESDKSQLVIIGKNFLSESSNIVTHNTNNRGLNISLSKHEVTTATNIDKQLTLVVTNNSGLSLNALTLIQTPNDNPKNPGNPILTVDTSNPGDLNQCVNISYLSPGKSCEYILDYSPNVVSSAYYLNVKLSVQSSRLLSNTENLTINNYPTTIIYGNSNATKVLVDQYDNIYISHDQGPGGIYVYFSKQDTNTVTGSIKPAVIMNKINIYNFTIDQNGWVYIASKRGLFVYKPDPDNYDQYIQYSQLSTSMVLSVFVDQHGYIYSGNSTLLIYKPYKLNRKHYKLVTTLTDKDGILGNSIRSIVVDPFGKLYVGSSDGLAIFKPDSNSDNGYDFPKQLKSNSVYDIFVNTDGEIYTATGYFYAGVYYGGVNIYYNENRDYQTITKINPNSTAHSVFVDRDGNIYVGTQNMGLLIYNKNYVLIETITMSDGLPSNYIGSIFVKSRNIYLATGAPQTPVNGNSLSIFPKPN